MNAVPYTDEQLREFARRPETCAIMERRLASMAETHAEQAKSLAHWQEGLANLEREMERTRAALSDTAAERLA